MKFDWKMLLDEILQSVIKEQLEKISKSKSAERKEQSAGKEEKKGGESN